MKFGIISGSTRTNNPQSLKVAKYVRNQVEKELKHDTYLLDLSQTQIKYWDETFWTDYKNFDLAWAQASKELHSCDAIIIIAPEWNGTIPPALKNIFHLATKGEFANKPGLIVSVSSGISGVYPVSELRLNSHKNTYLNYIPQHVIVRNVATVLNADGEEFDAVNDKLTRERLNHTLLILDVYAKAFVEIRNSEVIKNNPFPYGM